MESKAPLVRFQLREGTTKSQSNIFANSSGARSTRKSHRMTLPSGAGRGRAKLLTYMRSRIAHPISILRASTSSSPRPENRFSLVDKKTKLQITSHRQLG